MDDMVSRKAVNDALEKIAELYPWKIPGNRDTYDRYNEAWQDAVFRMETEIEQLPSAQPQRTGRWIHQVKFGRIECDQCGKVYRNAFVPKNYCPNCGASMTEKAEENDGTNER